MPGEHNPIKSRIWYHGTNETAAKQILNSGFREGTYFADCLADALIFGGNHVFEVALRCRDSKWQIVVTEAVPLENIVNYSVYTVEVKIEFADRRKAIFHENMEKDAL